MSDVLIVDDEVLVLEVAQAMLSRLGHQSSTALSGENAVSALSTGHYDLVLLDMVLPNMHGREVYKKIRQRSRLPVLFMTGYAEEADDLGVEPGDNVGFLRKPYTLDELQSKLAALLPREVTSPSGEDEDTTVAM